MLRKFAAPALVVTIAALAGYHIRPLSAPPAVNTATEQQQQPTSEQQPATEQQTATSVEQPVATSAAQPAASTEQPIFTPEQLTKYTGKPKGTPIYLAILGDVFDVTTGRKNYGPSFGYSFYAGRDATRAFTTGEGDAEGLTDNVDGLNLEDLKAVAGWHAFYVNHEEYKRVGIVVGRHYDADGKPLNHFPHERLAELEKQEAEVKAAMPDCNSRWTKDTGHEVWCTTKSGGVEREWVGYPRLYSPSKDPRFTALGDGEEAAGQDGSQLDRCVCAPTEYTTEPYLITYAGCNPLAERCALPKKVV